MPSESSLGSNLLYLVQRVSAFDAVAFAVGAFLLQRFVLVKPRARLPPGPKGLPIIGNMFDWPQTHAYKTFLEWRERYGDIVHCNVFGQHMIVLNKAQLAFDLFDRKGSIYSERPFTFFACELVGWKRGIVMSPYNRRLKDMRRVISNAVGTKAAVRGYAPMQESEVQKFLVRLLDNNGSRLPGHIRMLVGSSILNLSHGYEVTEEGDALIALAERSTLQASEALRPGVYLVDSVPSLRFLPSWLPGMSWKRSVADMIATVQATLDIPYNFVKEQLAAGTARPSIVGSHLEGRELSAYDEDVLKWSAASVYRAGSDTTVSAIHTFFLAMTLYPDVQQRAQAEIDSVVGSDQLPSAGDRDRLPYVDAVVKEAFRWGQIVPQGLIHVSKEDDVYNGYFIPKGTFVMPNIYGFTHDPQTYRDPMRFEPSRFLKTAEIDPEQDPKAYIFGFGRRVCPGALLADSSMWITCARALASLNIQKATDSDGNVIVPVVEYTSGILSHPKAFECSIKPRSKKAEDLVRDLANSA